MTYVDIARVPGVLNEDDVRQSQDETNEDAEEGKSANSGGPASLLLEDDGESGEEHLKGGKCKARVESGKVYPTHVKCSVNDCHASKIVSGDAVVAQRPTY